MAGILQGVRRRGKVHAFTVLCGNNKGMYYCFDPVFHRLLHAASILNGHEAKRKRRGAASVVTPFGEGVIALTPIMGVVLECASYKFQLLNYFVTSAQAERSPFSPLFVVIYS